jgi:hypothetical protein
MDDYVKSFKKFYEYKNEKIINNIDDINITEDNNNIKVKYSGKELSILKPKYIILKHDINNLNYKIKNINDQLNNIQLLYLTSKNNDYDNRIIKFYSILTESKNQLKEYLEIQDKLNEIKLSDDDEKRLEILEKIKNETDDIKIKNLFEKYHSLKKEYKDEEVKYFHKISESTSNNKIDDKIKKIVKKQSKKPVKDETIKKKIKEALFKTLDECESNKRSEKTYMSKEDILELINNKEELLKKMPKNYKTLSKKKLCEHYFK